QARKAHSLHCSSSSHKAGFVGALKRKATAGVAPRWLRLILLAILMIHYGAALIQYIELSCFQGDGKIPQRPVVETVDVLDGVAHIHGDLLPRHEAQIP